MSINLTLFGQLISFSIFVWICMKFIWPPLIGIMRERQQTIAAGLENADKAAQQLEQEVLKYENFPRQDLFQWQKDVS